MHQTGSQGLGSADIAGGQHRAAVFPAATRSGAVGAACGGGLRRTAGAAGSGVRAVRFPGALDSLAL